jgi:anthranilate synthase component 2
MHGKQSTVEIANETVLFQGLEETEIVGRYHSLIAEQDTLPEKLKVTAVSKEGEIMAVEDAENGVFGLQFHPESILTPNGKEMIQNFLAFSR